MSYTLIEYAELHYFYGVARGNGVEAVRLYREQLQRSGLFNIHNCHTWAIENPYAVGASTLTCGSGVLNGELIGPLELPTRLDGATYRNILEDDLPILLSDVNLDKQTFSFYLLTHHEAKILNA